jgi:hypothetical protein
MLLYLNANFLSFRRCVSHFSSRLALLPQLLRPTAARRPLPPFLSRHLFCGRRRTPDHLGCSLPPIISLYSAHTENLYALGAGQWLIGAHSTSTYPAEAAALPRFDYNGDPEALIAAEPDLVLIRPNIARKAPDFISALEKAGVLVVSLYPDNFEAFDGYISHLAMLTEPKRRPRRNWPAFTKPSRKSTASPKQCPRTGTCSLNPLKTICAL